MASKSRKITVKTRLKGDLRWRHMPGGEIDDVKSILPEAIRELWP